MKLVEFLAPLKRNKHQDRVLAVLYYRANHEQTSSMTTEQIREGLKRGRIPGWAKVNVADVLNKAGHLVDWASSDGGERLWSLTDSGTNYVRDLMNLPTGSVEVEHDAGTLEGIITSLHDADVRNYLDEAVKCLRVGALRACVVFVWAAAVRQIQTEVIAKGSPAVTSAINKHDPKARAVKTIDDFAYVKESTVLLAALDLAILDKNEKDALKEALDLRNRCGHPGKYRPGVKKVSAFVEDITSIVFT